MQKEIDEKWWAFIFRFVRRQNEASLKTTSENYRIKLKTLSERQDKPLGWRDEQSVKVLDNIELPDVRDKFNETHFLTDIDLFLSQLKNQKTSGETLCEIEAAAKAYAKNVRQTPRDKAVQKRGNISKKMGCWLCLLIRGLVFA